MGLCVVVGPFGGLVCFFLLCSGSLFELAEFLPLAKMTCAHRTHGVSTRAKKKRLVERFNVSALWHAAFNNVNWIETERYTVCSLDASSVSEK